MSNMHVRPIGLACFGVGKFHSRWTNSTVREWKNSTRLKELAQAISKRGSADNAGSWSE